MHACITPPFHPSLGPLLLGQKAVVRLHPRRLASKSQGETHSNPWRPIPATPQPHTRPGGESAMSSALTNARKASLVNEGGDRKKGQAEEMFRARLVVLSRASLSALASQRGQTKKKKKKKRKTECLGPSLGSLRATARQKSLALVLLSRHWPGI